VSYAAWVTLWLLTILLLIVVAAWMLSLYEMHHRSRELAKVVEPDQVVSLGFYALLESLLARLQPLPQADMSRLAQCITDFEDLIPIMEGKQHDHTRD
jgi:hypothetical protein